MALPGTILIAKMLMPETGEPQTAGDKPIEFEATSSNMFGAIAHGTSDGLSLALNVGAMLIAFIALIAFEMPCLPMPAIGSACQSQPQLPLLIPLRTIRLPPWL